MNRPEPALDTREGADPDPALGETLRAALAGFPSLRLAIVYGSVARQRARADSDLDMAVLADRPLSAEQRIAIIEAVSQATRRPVDMVDLLVERYGGWLAVMGAQRFRIRNFGVVPSVRHGL